MTKRRWIYRNGDFVEVFKAKPKPRVYIQTDSMDPLWHPATGQTCDSKSEFRRQTKESGCVEIGEKQKHNQILETEPPIEDFIEAAYQGKITVDNCDEVNIYE